MIVPKCYLRANERATRAKLITPALIAASAREGAVLCVA